MAIKKRCNVVPKYYDNRVNENGKVLIISKFVLEHNDKYCGCQTRSIWDRGRVVVFVDKCGSMYASFRLFDRMWGIRPALWVKI